jgi:heme exporter protein B
MMFALIRRELGLAPRQGAVLPLIFMLLVATLYPFAVGPDGALLARTGGGVIWIAALLAALLPIDRLIAPDFAEGVIDQLMLRGVTAELLAAAKIVAHWLSFGPLLMLAAVPAAALLRMDGEILLRLELGLLLGTPALAALGVLVASLTAGLPRSGALAGLLLLPLAIPVLIFGAGALGAGALGGDPSAIKLLAAAALFICAVAPFGAGAALRVAVES